jgi:hypothetical protein
MWLKVYAKVLFEEKITIMLPQKHFAKQFVEIKACYRCAQTIKHPNIQNFKHV